MQHQMQFCPSCGAAVERKVPAGDDRPRYVCSRDGEIFYHNPLVVVGCVATWDNRVLMCRRSIEPRAGFWTLPAGFLELGETTAEAGVRETREEALAEIEIEKLFSLINVPHIGQVHMFYRARMTGEDYAAGPESAEVVLMDEADIPWRELAFPTIYVTLEKYFADRRAGRFGLHTEDLHQGSWKRMRLKRTPSKPVA